MPTPQHLWWPSSCFSQWEWLQGSGPEVLQGDTPAAHHHQLGPPGPTSDPSPHLSTVLVQVGKVRHLVGGPVPDHLAPASGHSTAPIQPQPGLGRGGHPPAPQSTAQAPPQPAPQSQQSGPSPAAAGAPVEERVKQLAWAGRRGPGGGPEGHPRFEARAPPEWQ